MKFSLPLFLSLLLGLSLPVQARIYMYVDADGHKGATDRREAVPAGAKITSVIDLGGSQVPGGQAALRPVGKSSVKKMPSPVDFPRIDSGTQKKRDDVRRSVLEEELANEQKSLDEAKRQLAIGEKPLAGENAASASYQARVKQLQGAVERHGRNIVAIKKELDTSR